MNSQTFRFFTLFVSILTGLLLPLEAASSVSRHGVTWTFDRDYPTGQYCNGDWWVVGPVTITQITPGSTTGRHGTVVNPSIGSTQGFDDRFWSNAYNDALNIGNKLPKSVAANSSVVSCISKAEYVQYGQIEVFSILTVVSAAPAQDAFRPPYIGAGSRASAWKAAGINYGALNSLSSAAIGSKPNLTALAGYFAKTWYEQDMNWTGRFLHTPYMAENGYGKDMAVRTGDAALLLQLDYTSAQKAPLLIPFVQYGIDIHGIIAAGGTWYADGGHNCGRLAPLLVAATVLNDNGMKANVAGAAMKFQEHQQTFTVTQADVNMTGRVGTNGDPVYNYTSADIGMAEWGIRHSSEPQKDNNFWTASYRDIGGGVLTAPAMAARAMGVRSMVAWESLFLYAERHLNYEQSAGYKGEFAYNPTPAFHKEFYNLYKNASSPSGESPPPPPAPPLNTTYAIGDRITVSKSTNVRSSGGLAAPLIGAQSSPGTGTIVAGPVLADGIVWWQLDYDSGPDGWSGQDNFILNETQAPIKPLGLRVE